MKRAGYADLPLHGGKFPYWLSKRMAKLGGAITTAIVEEYGRDIFLTKLSDPFWFQSFGCVLGMDWHSSGITTSVMGALKKSLNPMAHDLGIFICGGRGKYSLQTPTELRELANKTGLNGRHLVRSSRLTAKVDNTAIQDGYSIYLHSFIVTVDGNWTVVQQGMNATNAMARRYHWHSKNLRSFVRQPHAAVYGKNKGPILNLTAIEADRARQEILNFAKSDPLNMTKEIRHLRLPMHHDVRSRDVDMKRLGSVITLAHDSGVQNFEELLLIKGLGPRTLQSLALVSEVIHGTPSRFTDPARFSFAHGGKDGHPFPVPLKVYDETITVLQKSIDRSRIDHSEKKRAIKDLHHAAERIEQVFKPNDESFDRIVSRERLNSHHYGGMTVNGPVRKQGQLSLF